MRSVAAFDPSRIFEVLAQHEVAFVLIGALAARLQGFPRMTADADITPEASPLEANTQMRCLVPDV